MKAGYNGVRKEEKALRVAPNRRGRSQGSQQIPGTHSGYMGLSAHLAGKPVVLRLMDAWIISVVAESRREHI
jgi:hypothetical protein